MRTTRREKGGEREGGERGAEGGGREIYSRKGAGEDESRVQEAIL